MKRTELIGWFMPATLLVTFTGGIAFAGDPSTCVDPFIGTANGGNTFPGAVRPWGMVSFSPHNAPGSSSGYFFGGKSCTGFGQVHLSGTGCADLGSIILTPVRDFPLDGSDPPTCTIGNEKASPGYYEATLVDPAGTLKATVARRSSVVRFSASHESSVTFVINAGQSLALTGGGSIRIVSPVECEGFNVSGGFCGESNRQNVYCVVRFSRPPTEAGLWMAGRMANGPVAAARDSALGAWFRYEKPAEQPITIKIGVSYTSIENARRNLDGEIHGWDFDEVLQEARTEWQESLQRIRVEGGSRSDSVRFYTALYHVLLHPNIVSDLNGDYPRMGGGIGHDSIHDRYSVFSLWDTYRTVHPLLSLVYPERQSAIVQSMLGMYRESGWLPKWELAGNETYMMSGDPAVPVIADTYVKGIQDFDAILALEAMLKPGRITTDTSAPPIRSGYHEYLKYHYIPFEQDTTAAWWVWGPASTTLEYCLADWATAQMARALHRGNDVEILSSRALWYRNLFDPATLFIRPKRKDGSWLTPFDPSATEGSGSWAGSGGPGYVEGSAWHYTWFVPHDVGGLMKLFGGAERFAAKLDSCFATGQFTINNEPDIAYPYLFTYVPGQEEKTVRYIRDIRERAFATGPSGLPGNDDCGTLSAWFVFSALGVYPDCPASGEYRIGTPLFARATIALQNKYYSGKSITFRMRGNPAAGRTKQSVRLNGSTLKEYHISHATLAKGVDVEFVITRSR